MVSWCRGVHATLGTPSVSSVHVIHLGLKAHMRYGVSVLSFVLFFSCAGRQAPTMPAARSGAPVVADVHLRGDVDFTGLERAGIERAAALLARATAGAVRVRVEWDLDYRTLQGTESGLLLRVESHYDFVTKVDANGTLLGVTSPERRTVFLVADRIVREGAEISAVALHEFGHLFGVGHLEVPGALMGPVYAGVLCLTPVDLAALCQVTGCDSRFSNPCP